MKKTVRLLGVVVYGMATLMLVVFSLSGEITAENLTICMFLSAIYIELSYRD